MNEYYYKFGPVPERTLTHEETANLFRQFYAGSLEARDRLIEENLRLVLFHVSTTCREITEEAISAGNEALVNLINSKRFDPDKGFAFGTYAAPFLISAITATFRIFDGVSFPPNKVPHWRDDEFATGNMDARRHLTLAAAIKMGLCPEAEENGFEPEQVDYPLLQDALATLSPKERQVVMLTLVEGLHVTEAAKEVGVCRQRAHDLKRKALKKLRSHFGVENAPAEQKGICRVGRKFQVAHKGKILGLFSWTDAHKTLREAREQEAA